MPLRKIRTVQSAPGMAAAFPVKGNRLAEALAVARQQGLLSGGRTLTLRGRMPSLLVEQAKRRSGIDSDSRLIEVALANLAVGDDYADWLLAQRGMVTKDLELEF